MPTIEIPHDPNQKDGRWRPREYQRDLWTYLEKGGKRAIEVAHRRSGKDELGLHWACVAAHLRVGNYWHCLPEASQSRKAIWDAVDPIRKKRRIDIAFPQAIRKTERASDMWIEFHNGSTWQVIGSDNFNSLVGTPPVGIVFSEWALADPLAWAYLLPIVEENDGWALFITTPRGPNHAQVMYDAAQGDPDWYSGLHSVKDTKLLSAQNQRGIKKEYMRQFGDVLGASLYEQEYECSFEAAVLGAVYGSEMREAREEGRITDVPYDPGLQVETWWDLGWRDPCAIWFIQRTRSGQLRAIDYYEQSLSGLDHYARVLQERKYVYSRHYVPHDAGKGELGSGITLIEQASKLGLKLTRMPMTRLEAGIQATRAMIPKMVFDAKRTERGIQALTMYKYEYDQEKKRLSAKPVHDWASHGADALRTGAGTKGKEHKRERPPLPEVAIV
jgi:hypothetical protein